MLVGIHMGADLTEGAGPITVVPSGGLVAPPASGASTTEMIDNHTAADILAAANAHASAQAMAAQQASVQSANNLRAGVIVGVGLLFGWAMLTGKSHGLVGARL